MTETVISIIMAIGRAVRPWWISSAGADDIAALARLATAAYVAAHEQRRYTDEKEPWDTAASVRFSRRARSRTVVAA